MPTPSARGVAASPRRRPGRGHMLRAGNRGGSVALKRLDLLTPDRLVLPDARPSTVWRTTVPPSTGSNSNQCSACNASGLTTRKARAAPGRSNSSQSISPASYKRRPCSRGAGVISVGQTQSKSETSAAIRSGGAATVRSWRFLIFIRRSPHLTARAPCTQRDQPAPPPAGGSSTAPARCKRFPPLSSCRAVSPETNSHAVP
jgi:hypothetical protein